MNRGMQTRKDLFPTGSQSLVMAPLFLSGRSSHLTWGMNESGRRWDTLTPRENIKKKVDMDLMRFNERLFFEYFISLGEKKKRAMLGHWSNMLQETKPCQETDCHVLRQLIGLRKTKATIQLRIKCA